MSIPYSGDPSTSDLDKFRFKLGDRREPYNFTPEEFAELLSDEGSVDRAVLAGAKILLAEFAKKVDKSIGKTRVAYSQAFTNMADFIKRLESDLSVNSGFEGLELGHWDADLSGAQSEPVFDLGMNDNSRASRFYNDGLDLDDVE